MKTKQYGVVLTLGFLIASSVFAGDRVGNSSKTVICYSADPKLGGKVVSVELLDFFEAKEVKGLTIDLPEAGDVDEMVIDTFKKLENLDPTRMKRYLDAYKLLKKSSRFTNRAAISEIDDGWSPVEGKDHCYIRQLAVQSKPPTQFDPWLLVDNGIWEKMIPRERAGFWIHESILHEEVKAGVQISDGTRSFTGILASDRFHELDRDGYFEVIQSLLVDKSFPTNVDGIWLNNPVFETHPNGRLKSGTLLSETEFPLNPRLRVVCLGGARASFRADGELDSCTLNGLQLAGQDRINIQSFFSRHPDGMPKVRFFSLVGKLQIRSGTLLIPIEPRTDARDMILALCPHLDQRIPYGKLMMRDFTIKISNDDSLEISTMLATELNSFSTATSNEIKFRFGSSVTLPSCEEVATAMDKALFFDSRQ